MQHQQRIPGDVRSIHGEPVSKRSTLRGSGRSQRPAQSAPGKPKWPSTAGGFVIFGWLLLIHLTAVAGLILFPYPGMRVLMMFLLLSFLGGLGITIVYHRALAHRSVNLHPAVETVLIFLAMLNGAAPPVSWVLTHRLHHATAETADDPSSPAWGGFWFAHVAWLWQPRLPAREKYSRDLKQFYLGIWGKLVAPMFTIAFFAGAYFGWAAFFWLGAIRLVFVFHATSFVNSVCHTEPGVALGEDSSRNVLWIAPLQFFIGENWHRNHHQYPGSARLGLTWRQFDVGYLTILALEKLGLATEVRRPSQEYAKAANG